jgi:serpin B
MSHRTTRFRSRHSLLLTLSIPLVACSVACGGGSSGGGSSGSGDQAVATARAPVARIPASSVSAADLAGAVTANNAFAVDLYAHQRAAATKPGNLLTSPLSASLALTMTYAGAQGSTATGMAQALHLGSSTASTIFAGQNALDQALASRAATALAGDQHVAQESGEAAPSPSDYDLTVVNSVWGEKTYTWATPFLDILASDYGSGVYLSDFVHAFDQARQAINGWVSGETADRINDLLPPGSLDDTTRMVLVNAIHLKLPWANAFQTSATAPASFTRADGSQVTTSFMNQQQTFGYVDDGRAQIVSLPLTGGQETVLIALPHGDLATYEASLTAGSTALTPPPGQALVALSLPKVSFTSPTFSLAGALQAMGMTDAFNRDTADFRGLCANPPDAERLYVSDVLQKAMLGMQETGVEAAAATAVIVAGTAVGMSNPPTPVPMVVNRPFVVSIVDVPTGAVLFLGHIEDPTATGSP